MIGHCVDPRWRRDLAESRLSKVLRVLTAVTVCSIGIRGRLRRVRNLHRSYSKCQHLASARLAVRGYKTPGGTRWAANFFRSTKRSKGTSGLAAGAPRFTAREEESQPNSKWKGALFRRTRRRLSGKDPHRTEAALFQHVTLWVERTWGLRHAQIGVY
jgi:hypothetical protein